MKKMLITFLSLLLSTTSTQAQDQGKVSIYKKTLAGYELTLKRAMPKGDGHELRLNPVSDTLKIVGCGRNIEIITVWGEGGKTPKPIIKKNGRTFMPASESQFVARAATVKRWLIADVKEEDFGRQVVAGLLALFNTMLATR